MRLAVQRLIRVSLWQILWQNQWSPMKLHLPVQAWISALRAILQKCLWRLQLSAVLPLTKKYFPSRVMLWKTFSESLYPKRTATASNIPYLIRKNLLWLWEKLSCQLLTQRPLKRISHHFSVYALLLLPYLIWLVHPPLQMLKLWKAFPNSGMLKLWPLPISENICLTATLRTAWTLREKSPAAVWRLRLLLRT